MKHISGETGAMTTITTERRPNLDFDLVRKTPVPVVVRTNHHFIIGNFFIRPAIRLIDEFINGERFIALTDATVFDVNGRLCYRTKFITISREHVEWVIPKGEMEEKTNVRQGATGPGQTGQAPG
jgi:hypothetical protein